MQVWVRAIRPTVAGVRRDPGDKFYLGEEDAVHLESRGIVERVHEVKMAAPHENKMAAPAEAKVPLSTESLKPRRRRRK